MKTLTCALLIILTGSCSRNSTVDPLPDSNKAPNVLLILVDDLGNHDLGATGSMAYETPNIDRIAQNGTMFTTGYANSAVCSPSRASLMSGLYVTKHGVTDWIGAKTGEDWRRNNRASKLLPPENQHLINHGLTTLPEALKTYGYRTFFAGKWHLGGEKEESLPTDHGFDINVGGYHVGSPASGRFFSPFNNPQMKDEPREAGLDLSQKLAQETATFLESSKDSPFFAMLSFYAVHAPIQTSEDKWRKYRDKIVAMGVKDAGFEMERMLPIRRTQDNPVYAGLVEQVDDAVGIVLDKLKTLGLDQNTIVIFTSDNGGVVSGDNYSTSNAPLRGGKGYQFEGGTRVPFFIYVPWLNNTPKTNSTPVMGIDIYPTLVDLIGQELPTKVDGQSLFPLLKGDTLAERSLFWHYPHYGNQGGEPNSTIRRGRYKLIRYWEDDRRELYDLWADPGEQNDLVAEKSEVAARLDGLLNDWLVRTDASLPLPDPLYDPAKAAAVRERFVTQKMPALEKLRKEQLQEDYRPNKNWWGSVVD